MLRCLFHSSSVWVAEQPMLRPQELKDHMVVQHKAIKPFAPWHRDTPAGCPYTVKTVKLFRHYRVTCLGLVGQLFHPSVKTCFYNLEFNPTQKVTELSHSQEKRWGEEPHNIIHSCPFLTCRTRQEFGWRRCLDRACLLWIQWTIINQTSHWLCIGI